MIRNLAVLTATVAFVLVGCGGNNGRSVSGGRSTAESVMDAFDVYPYDKVLSRDGRTLTLTFHDGSKLFVKADSYPGGYASNVLAACFSDSAFIHEAIAEQAGTPRTSR